MKELKPYHSVRDRDEFILAQRADDGQEALDQCQSITAHIDTLLEPDFLAAIGASKNEELHMRVFRIIRELNKLRGDDVNPHEDNYETCPNCGHHTLPTRARNCSNCHWSLNKTVVPPPQILC